ncbi:MAG: TOBE domain-containing protein, partial [Gemmatimonadales bacterium]
DQEEALTMSDRIVLMRQGRIEQIGSPRDLYDRPASRYVADFIGETNLLTGMVVESGSGEPALRVGDVVLHGRSETPLAVGSDAWLAVRPEAIEVAAEGATPGPGNRVTATVNEAVYAGSAVRLHATLARGQRIVAHLPAGTSIPVGATVTMTWAVDRGRFVPE